MLDKVNLLKQRPSPQEERPSIDNIVPRALLGNTPLDANHIMVKPGMDSLPYTSGKNRDILYCIEGMGKVRVNTEMETLESGDRITLSSDQQYVIVNDGNDLLHVLQIIL